MRPQPLILSVALLLLAGLSACREGYDNNDAELAVRQRAKDMCSCIFVMKRSETDCLAWTKVTPDVARPKVDYSARRVTAVALGFYQSSARFRDGLGCSVAE